MVCQSASITHTARNDKQATSTNPSELAFPALTPNSTAPHGMSSRCIRDHTAHEIDWDQPKHIINVTLAEHPDDIDLVDIARSRRKHLIHASSFSTRRKAEARSTSTLIHASRFFHEGNAKDPVNGSAKHAIMINIFAIQNERVAMSR